MSIAAAPVNEEENPIVTLMSNTGELVSAVKVSASAAGMLRGNGPMNPMQPMMHPTNSMPQMPHMQQMPQMMQPTGINPYASLNPNGYGMNPQYSQAQMSACGPSAMFGNRNFPQTACSMTPNTANRVGCNNPTCPTCTAIR